MAEFVCVMKQKAEGCDYTIGCGTVAYSFDAADWNDAFQKAKVYNGWDEYEDDDYSASEVDDRFISGEYALESFVLYQVDSKIENLLEIYVDNLIRDKVAKEEDHGAKVPIHGLGVEGTLNGLHSCSFDLHYLGTEVVVAGQPIVECPARCLGSLTGLHDCDLS